MLLNRESNRESTYSFGNITKSEWKLLLQSNESKRSRVNCQLALRRYDVEKGYIQDAHSSRELYNHLVSKNHIRSHMERHWAENFDLMYSRHDWQNVWNLCTNVQEHKLRIFRYKMLHNILPCRYLLHRWHIIGKPSVF